MPEIWIPYGDVEISVDIDSNNLSGIFINEKTEFDDTILENNQILNNLNEKVTIFDICNSIGSISIIEMLIEIIKNSKRTNQIEIIILIGWIRTPSDRNRLVKLHICPE